MIVDDKKSNRNMSLVRQALFGGLKPRNYNISDQKGHKFGIFQMI